MADTARQTPEPPLPGPFAGPSAGPRWALGTLVGIGLVWTVLVCDLATLVVLVAVSLLVAAVAVSCEQGRAFGPRRDRAAWLRRVCVVAGGLVAGVGVLSVAGGLGLLVWGCALASIRWLSRPRAAAPSAATTADEDGTAPPPAAPTQPRPMPELPRPDAVPHLSDADLCLTWRMSFVQVQHAEGPAQLEKLAQTRQACLDELERRHPESFQAWLRAGARAASDPARYLVGGTGGDPRRSGSSRYVARDHADPEDAATDGV